MKMEDIKLNPRQERFVKMANEEGFTNKISRKDIIILQNMRIRHFFLLIWKVSILIN